MIVPYKFYYVTIVCHISIIVEMNSDDMEKMKKDGIIETKKGVGFMQYKDAIIKLVGKIRSEKSLKRIYKLVSYLYTHED